MEIKIKLPNNVRVSCPTAESAIVILKSLQLEEPSRTDFGDTYPNEDAGLGFGASYSSSRPWEGESFNALADASAEEAISDFETPDESDFIEENLIDGSSLFQDLEAVNNLRKKNASSERATVTDSLPNEENDIFLPSSVGSRTRQMFDFVRERSFFSTEEANLFAQNSMGMEMNKKNRKKILSSLKTLERAGVLQKTADGWQKVA